MSTNLEAAAEMHNSERSDTMMCRASCGITEEDEDIKLKTCHGCKLVRYCIVECQREHRPQNKGVIIPQNEQRSCRGRPQHNNNMMCCASCGIGENDDIKLTKCTACKSVRYCSVKCQRDHQPEHRKACKKRVAELRDEILFKQPEGSHYGDCPICCLPLSIDAKKCTLMACCSKVVCDGCDYANQKREAKESLERRCPFCRHPVPSSREESDMKKMKRIEANDPVALREVGKQRCYDGDYKSAFGLLSEAAELGDVEAHFHLSTMYDKGSGVEKDEKKDVYHLEKAAIGGHPGARHNLGCVEWDNCRHERAVKHFVIAAKLGYNDSLENLKEGF
jgi:hypothetical protein